VRVKTWYAEVVLAGTDATTTLRAQAQFITTFLGALFVDLDAGRLGGAASAHFHRLAQCVRFRVLGTDLSTATAEVDRRLAAAKTASVISDFHSEAETEWEKPGSPDYGTEVPGVTQPFTDFMEAVSRATIALLKSSGDTAVSEAVLWNWLHLVHNPMTGLTRDLVEVAPRASVHQL